MEHLATSAQPSHLWPGISRFHLSKKIQVRLSCVGFLHAFADGSCAGGPNVHLFCYLVHVTDVGSLIRIGVYAHADQLPQLKDSKTGKHEQMHWFRTGKGDGNVSDHWSARQELGTSPRQRLLGRLQAHVPPSVRVPPPSKRARKNLFHQTFSTEDLNLPHNPVDFASSFTLHQ